MRVDMYGLAAGDNRDFVINFFFFFQAEDGIRDYKVTGVQTCALPISQWTAEFVGSGVTSLHPAATPITHGATLYGLSVFWSGPSFPAANTTVIPLSCKIGRASCRERV